MSISPVSSSATPVIRCRHLRVGYGSFVLMKDISFDVMPGDIFFITGGSGCGKSTLLRVLMGLKAPQAGTVSFGDTPFWPGSDGDRLKVRRRTGVLFQQGALWSSMTLAENIALPLRQYTSLSDRDIRRQALLKRLDLPEHMSAKALLTVLNALYTSDEVIQLVQTLPGPVSADEQ